MIQVKLTFLVAKLGSCSKRHMICALFPLAADTSHSFSRGSSYKILSPMNVRMSHLPQLFQALHYSLHWFPIISLMYLLIPLFAHLHKLLRSWNRLQGWYSSEYNLLQRTCNKYNETLHVLLVLPLKSHPLLDTKRHYNYAKYWERHLTNIILRANSSK